MSEDQPVLEMEVSDAVFVQWMRGNLDRAARHFAVSLTGEPALGWRLRTIGAPASGPSGARWLRVVTDYPQWAHGDGWTGNSDANQLIGIPKPQLLDKTEWEDGGRQQRGELLTLLPGQPPSPTEVLRTVVTPPDGWWTELRESLGRLRDAPTARVHISQDTVVQRGRTILGTELRIQHWETVHGDLHWSNLLAPRLGIVDWELWGRGPAGLDAASLLCHSLLVPTVATRVHDVFSDVLDSPDGQIAQLVVAARLLRRIAGGDYPELEAPLRAYAAALTARLTAAR